MTHPIALTDPAREPVEHPLSKATRDWRWFRDPVRNTHAVVHRSGLWVEVCAESLDDAESASIASALEAGLAIGAVGLHTVEGTLTDGCYTSRLVKA